MKRFGGTILFLALATFILLCPAKSRAFQIEAMPDTAMIGDFVLNQTKTEARLNPGENGTRNISLTNRSGADLYFTVSVEDFSASDKRGQNIDLLGEQAGIYSLKDYLKPEIAQFVLRHGERITLPVAINIPENAQPGGLYGAVIFSASLSEDANADNGQVKTIPRLASLFFVRVSGDTLEKGELKDFFPSKSLYFGGPAVFEFNYRNTGNIYLNPYGELRIKDFLGREVYAKWLPPYFVMPQAVRQQKEIFERHGAWGLYQATLKLNRGYGNIIDQKSAYFFILPYQMILILIIAVILLFWLVMRIIRYFRKY